MPRVHDAKIILYLTKEQKADLDMRSRAAGLSAPNYLRFLLGWPAENRGRRKDLITTETRSVPAKQSDSH